jgi:hypothetical protein
MAEIAEHVQLSPDAGWRRKARQNTLTNGSNRSTDARRYVRWTKPGP